ncbi:MAG TPA: DoxX family protein [Chlamydiales bacterium]|jgi:putative oxidoreductase
MFKNRFLQLIALIYNWLVKGSSNLQSLFLLWMRVTWGHQFFLSGVGKLSHIGEVAQFFTTLHINHPEFHAHLVAWVETVGGICLIAGFASRLVAIPLAIAMITALSTAHASTLSNFRFLTEPSSLVHESPYPFLITSLLILFFGPGRFSVDGWLKRWANRQPKY